MLGVRFGFWFRADDESRSGIADYGLIQDFVSEKNA